MASMTKTMATIHAYGIETTSARNDTSGYFFFVVMRGQYVARFDFDSEHNSIGAAIVRNDNYINVSRAYALRCLRTHSI
jgi:hypothetical protein